MKIDEALSVLTNTLVKDKRVQAIFVKGSLGRGEQDEHSDLDLYCLVDDVDLSPFLQTRVSQLETYGKLLFYDDIYIVAPQIIAVYENMVHVDLFTVTDETFVEKDFFQVIHDPQNRLKKFEASQTLQLSAVEFQDAVDDVAWFLFQYQKSAARGNDLWSVNMLNHVMTNLSRVLLHRYKPDRAQLGVKALKASLPSGMMIKMEEIQEHITPNKHSTAVVLMQKLLEQESNWVISEVAIPDKISPLWHKMLQY
ncbi:aminoglycoside 6-adenylyltransferase [Mesobacillus thioparans]|uniref:aminoglycoside 6-adenylyltransferase n=1 Tax=Mesobacillus thioparans TaxID=370439 RepID=UPI0039EE48E8